MKETRNAMKGLLASFTAAAMMAVSAPVLAESISFEATVVPKTTCEVYAPLGGMINTVGIAAGDRVEAGQELAALRTEKLLSTVNGTVVAVFGKAGEDAAAVAAQYGAVMYIDPEVKYTISGSLSNAYSSVESTYVTPGEEVWLVAANTTTRTGKGRVTLMDADTYTVQVTSGSFIVGETVYIYNESTYSYRGRIGSGAIARSLPVAIAPETGTLAKVSVAVGDRVSIGDTVAEILSGSLEAGESADGKIIAPVSGVMASVSMNAGAAVEDNGLVAVIYPDDAMQLQGLVSEEELGSLRIGLPVSIAFTWNEDSGETVQGMVTAVSALAETDADGRGVYYRVSVDINDTTVVRYGMTAEVSAE